VRQQCVGGDVERHAEEEVGAALIELAAEPAAGHEELEERMARQERHALELADVPGTDDDAPRVRVLAQRRDRGRHLVDVAPVRRDPVAPLLAVHRPELAVLVGPFVPDRDALLAQRADVGLAAQEPKQLVDDALQVQLLGRHDREARREVEAQLRAEDRERPGPGAVLLAGAVVAHVAQQVEVLPHRAQAAW